MNLENQKTGYLLKELRQAKGYSQLEFGEMLALPVSTIQALEQGASGLEITQIIEISKKLSLSKASAPKSIDFEIQGGQQLSGTIATNYSKNGAMGLLCASLLNFGKTTLHGIPRIEEVNRILEVLESIGVKTEWSDANTLAIQRPKKLSLENINDKSARRTRTILMFLGSLIHEYNEFELPNSQGCTLGKRTISAHLYGLEKFGVGIEVQEDKYLVKSGLFNSKSNESVEIVMYEAGDTATENLLITAAKYPGKTIIKFASANYMVQDVCFFLQKLGVIVEGVGTQTLTIQGLEFICKDVEFYNSPDPIESMMFLSAGICTNSHLTITRCPINFLELELLKLEKMGLKFELSNDYLAENNETRLVDIVIQPSKLIALDDKITCGPYPDINSDNLPFFVPICCLATGTTLIHDWMYENRAIYFTELNRLGAKISLADPHRVYVDGPVEFKAAQMACPPALRPAMIILIAMLASDGTSILRNVYSIKRGYEEVATRLNSLGAKIRVLN